MAASALDLSKLPPPAAVETLSFEALVAGIKADLIARLPEDFDLNVLDLESEPIVKLMEAFAYREQLLRSRMNHQSLAATLAFSNGADLDVAVANLGVARLEGESDEALRARAVLAPESWSTAGPEDGYRFHARSADPAVADVGVSSPSPGICRIVVLSTAEDGIADEDLLAAVAASLRAEDIRPVTDNVQIVSAEVVVWDVEAVLKIPAGPDAGTLLAVADAAIRKYGADHRKVGKGIPLLAVSTALMPPGVEDLDLVSPAAPIAADPDVAPVLGTVTLSVEIIP